MFDARLRQVVPRIVLCAALMGVYLLAFSHYAQAWFHGAESRKLLALALLVCGGGFIYFAAAQAFGVLRIQDMKKYFVRKPKIMPANLESLEAEGQE